MSADSIGLRVLRALDVDRREVPALAWSFAYFFLVLAAYYVLRPIRDEMGVLGGVRNLAWLFTGTLIGTLLLHPLYTWLVSRLTRARFIAYTYRFFIANLIGFYVLFSMVQGAGDASRDEVWVGRLFFIWVSVFNLFVVSVFWSYMTDVYRPAQGKRLFGVIAVGGTLGALGGSSVTAVLVEWLGAFNLMLLSALLLELAARSARRLGRYQEQLNEAERVHDAPVPAVGLLDAAAPSAILDGVRSRQDERVIGGGVLDGISHVLKSPYLLGIAALMLLFTIASTFLYFQRMDIVAREFADDSVARVRLFGTIDAATNLLTLLTQLFLTGRLLRWLGVGFGLAFLPAVSLIGFAGLGMAPVLWVVVAFEVIRRAGNFALARPAREVLYTVMSRSDRYKAKNFNDTFVYRLGDQIGSWSYTAMGWLGLGMSGLALTMVPVSLVWVVLALWLARQYNRKAAKPPE